MFGNGQLIHCQQRKAALLQQSAAHRLALMTDAQTLRPVADWIDLGIAVACKVRMGWSVLAPLFSLGRTRKQESSDFVHKLAGAIALARSLMEVWKGWK
jgi:hypothetical protein